MQNRQLYILCCMFPSLLLINENWFYVWSTETKSVSNAMWKEGNITYVTSDIQIQGFDHFSTFELLSTFRFIGYGRAVYSKKLRQLPYWQSIYSCRMFEFSQGFPLATQYHAVKLSSTWFVPERVIGQQSVCFPRPISDDSLQKRWVLWKTSKTHNRIIRFKQQFEFVTAALIG